MDYTSFMKYTKEKSKKNIFVNNIMITKNLFVLFIATFWTSSFLSIIPIVLIAWVVKVSITLYFILKNDIISNYLKY